MGRVGGVQLRLSYRIIAKLCRMNRQKAEVGGMDCKVSKLRSRNRIVSDAEWIAPKFRLPTVWRH